MSKLKGMAVFPCKFDAFNQYGMTLRQYYAGLAMQGLSGNSFYAEFFRASQMTDDGNLFARLAVSYADALIAQLEKQESEG